MTGSATSDNFVRPEGEGNALRNLLTELSGAPPASLSKRIDAQQELTPLQSVQNGFAAIKAAARQPTDPTPVWRASLPRRRGGF